MATSIVSRIPPDAHPLTLKQLLDRGEAIARDVALGDTAVTAVVVGLPEGGPKVVVFVKGDRHPASRREAAALTSELLQDRGIDRWLSIVEAELVLPAGRREAVLAITACAGDARMTRLLEVERDAGGVICGLPLVADPAKFATIGEGVYGHA